VRPLVVDLGRDYRGGQHQALLLLQGLVARGHAPELITIRESLLAQRARSVGVQVNAVDRRWPRVAAAFVIRNLLSQRRVDIVHANEPHALTAAWLARAHRRVPLVASRRVIFPLSRGIISLARYRAAARIVAVSQFVASAVVTSGLPGDRLSVIPDGVPIPQARTVTEREAARRSLGIEADALFIGCVAVLTPDKGQETLIRALPAIRTQFPRCQVLLVGDGPCRAALGALARENNLGDAVHFAGFVEDLDRVYTAIDLFAFPAQAEALGSALLSAMAHGLPVVALGRGGIPEVVESGSTGLLTKEPGPGEMAAAILRLLLNPDEMKRLGKAAREAISTRFSVDHMAEGTLRLYEDLLAAR
jgi:glycosyltransferase involved in cell wall biosynthesis